MEQHPVLSLLLALLAALDVRWLHRFSLPGTASRRLIMMPTAVRRQII
jgi:hypothetical protein